MKKLTITLSLILTVTLFVPSFAVGQTFLDLVKRGGLYYKKFNCIPFTGKTTVIVEGSFSVNLLEV